MSHLPGLSASHLRCVAGNEVIPWWLVSQQNPKYHSPSFTVHNGFIFVRASDPNCLAAMGHGLGRSQLWDWWQYAKGIACEPGMAKVARLGGQRGLSALDTETLFIRCVTVTARFGLSHVAPIVELVELLGVICFALLWFWCWAALCVR